MKPILIFIMLTLCSAATASTPIDGLYTNVFGGYAYVPNNINHSYTGNTLNHVNYEDGFEAGGSIGYKSNPMRYEGEITYLQANVKNFNINGVQQTDTGGSNQDLIGMANIYFDFPSLNTLLQPYLGAGIGYGWFQTKLNTPSSATIPVTFSANTAIFAYQGIAGMSFNFSENYALNLNYRYVGTEHLGAFGEMFQAHIANVGGTYRFDGPKYK